jgi:hypothetical protein
MSDIEPRGAVHWIDHYVVGTNDMVAWADWAVNATGITRRPLAGQSPGRGAAALRLLHPA